MTTEQERPLVIVSKSEPADACARLSAFGLNATSGEAGTDYVWFPHGCKFGIERKTVSNLLGSLKDRQLAEQAQRGVKDFDCYIILIEGDYRRRGDGVLEYYSPRDPRARGDWVESGWRWDAIQGMLFDFKLLGAMVEHWPVLHDYPTAVSRIVLATTAEHHRFLQERQRPDLPPLAMLAGKTYSDALWALMALPGCGAEVAQALLEEYGSLASAIHCISLGTSHYGLVADVKVNGKRLGEKRAQKLRDACNAGTPGTFTLVQETK